VSSSSNVSWNALPSIFSTYASSPHWKGEPAPSGGGGMNFAMPVKMSPTPLSRRHAVMPSRPPGLQTRASSAATRA
jgi:hypothetical protein